MAELADPTQGLWGKATLKKKFPHLRQEIKDMFLKEDVQIHQPAITKFPRRQTLSKKIGLNVQADLMEIAVFEAENDHYRYLLTSIDVLSRFARVVPLHNKTAAEIIRGLTLMFADEQPSRLSSDRGSEFMAQAVRTWLSQNHIYFFALNPPIKGAIIERFHRTLWLLINRYQRMHNTYRFIDVLPDLVANYNSRIHSTIGMAPKDVTVDNQDALYQKIVQKTVDMPVKKPKYGW
jgi:transposase InsO family protein